MADITRTLPPDDVPVCAPAIETLSEVLCRSIEQTLAYVYQATPEQGLKVVQRLRPDGSEGVYVAFPNYWSAPVWEAFKVAFDAGAAQPLTDYLWQCGMPRMTLTGPDPDAHSWARFVAYQYIAQPIRYLLVDRSITLAVDGKEPWPAKLDPEAVREFALRAARDICTRTKRVRAWYVQPSLRLDQIDSVELPGNMSILSWTPRERCLFQTRYGSVIEWDDMPLYLFSDHVCTISLEVPEEESLDAIRTRVADILNLHRLCLALEDRRQWEASEGPVVIMVEQSVFPPVLTKLARDQRNSWPQIQIDQAIAERWATTARNLLQYERVFRHSIWRFGRACTASLAQDRLVEAVIGMEALLLTGPGEARFRFGVLGTTMLQPPSDEARTLFRELQELYGLRSGSVHGQHRGNEEQSRRAVELLVDLIDRFLGMASRGLLGPGETPAEKAQEILLRRAVRSEGDQ